MANQYTKWERYFHKLNIFFHGIVAISMIPFAYAFLETQKDFSDPPMVVGDQAMALKFTLIAISLAILVIAFRYDKKRNFIGSNLDLVDRLSVYSKHNVRFYLLIQLSAIAACSGLYLLKDQFFSFLYVIVLFVFSQTRPTYDRVMSQNELSEEEKEELNELTEA
ncbi:MAG: hypothetical protein ACJA0X_000266 [Cyclobacteriaceae bacterium]|jgi:hypothetical protein